MHNQFRYEYQEFLMFHVEHSQLGNLSIPTFAFTFANVLPY